DGLLKVLDFGMARRLVVSEAEDFAPGTRATAPGTRVGTPLYMSPEQARAEPVGSATDIFSLGLVLYELTTGQHPFAGDSGAGPRRPTAPQDPLPPGRLNREVPAPLDALIRQMLSKDPGARPTAAQVAAVLQNCGLQIADCGLGSGNPQSAIRNPQ